MRNIISFVETALIKKQMELKKRIWSMGCRSPSLPETRLPLALKRVLGFKSGRERVLGGDSREVECFI